jgi:hypothetical protein
MCLRTLAEERFGTRGDLLQREALTARNRASGCKNTGCLVRGRFGQTVVEVLIQLELGLRCTHWQILPLTMCLGRAAVGSKPEQVELEVHFDRPFSTRDPPFEMYPGISS